MRHHRRDRTLGRVKRQREALLRGLARSLVLQEGITTTLAKAKELRPYVERLVTTGKKSTLASRRTIISALGKGEASRKMSTDIAGRFAKRTGGYTRIVHLGRIGKRVGEMARIEFVK